MPVHSGIRYSRVSMYDAAQLGGMTVKKIKGLAAERGYTITAGAKAEIINEFLEQQEQ